MVAGIVTPMTQEQKQVDPWSLLPVSPQPSLLGEPQTSKQLCLNIYIEEGEMFPGKSAYHARLTTRGQSLKAV